MIPNPKLFLTLALLCSCLATSCQSKVDDPSPQSAAAQTLAHPASLDWLGKPGDLKPTCGLLGWSSTTDGSQHGCDMKLENLPGTEHSVLVSEEAGQILSVAMRGTHAGAAEDVKTEIVQYLKPQLESREMKEVSVDGSTTRFCSGATCIDVKVEPDTWFVNFIADVDAYDTFMGR